MFKAHPYLSDGQRLLQVCDDIVNILNANAQANRVRGDAGSFGSSELSWRCVVEAGCTASDLESPMLTSRLNSLSAS